MQRRMEAVVSFASGQADVRGEGGKCHAGSNDAAFRSLSSAETALRKTAENTVKHRDKGKKGKGRILL